MGRDDGAKRWGQGALLGSIFNIISMFLPKSGEKYGFILAP